MSTITAPRPGAHEDATRHTRTRRVPSRLGRYTDDHRGATREIVCVPGAGGSRLVIDRDALTLGDSRLVAHLAADELPENAQIVSELYLTEEHKGDCRRVSAEDFALTPFASCPSGPDSKASPDTSLVDREGVVYRIQEVSAEGSFPELRWTRSCRPGEEEQFDPVTLRNVVGRMENYEPARTITTAALTAHEHDRRVSTYQLQCELERLGTSEIVLNRGLREAVQRRVASGELSMSEIALRCGRIKRDARGNRSGETSWLARRIGQNAQGGKNGPTPWIHTDVLALIVRDGLSSSPNEVEL